MIVMKFGGSSLATVATLTAARDQILRTAADDKVAVVVSAIGKTTDCLIAARSDVDLAVDRLLAMHAHALELVGAEKAAVVRARIEDLPRWIDRFTDAELHAFGEILSSTIMHALLQRAGATAQDFGLEALMLRGGPTPVADLRATADRFDELGFDVHGPEICVVGGFAGIMPSGHLRLLGRGGSDTSATSIGAALGARVIELWKDVDGIHPSDPRAGSVATEVIANMHWSEADTLARTGARILHALSIEPAWRRGIPIHVRHTGFPDEPGTWIAEIDSNGERRRSVA